MAVCCTYFCLYPQALPKLESKEVMKMLRLLQLAYAEISKEYKEGEKNTVLGE